jgi:xanthine dehydrogenase accessory factor
MSKHGQGDGMRQVAEAILEVLASGRRGALATVVKTSGSTPQCTGARLLLRADGTTVGTIGGGAIEYTVLEALRGVLETGKPSLTTHDLGYDLGMCCGGRMEVFVEAIESAPRLWLLGAGHVSKPTAGLARSTGFEVTVVDEREELNTEERFPGCRRIVEDPAAFVRAAAVTPCDWLVVATHDHHLDEQVLDAALQKGARYVGMLGSRRKVFRFVQRLGARRGELDLRAVYAPVGIDIGAVTPEEIALSIVGELVALRHGKSANHLRTVDAFLPEPSEANEPRG